MATKADKTTEKTTRVSAHAECDHATSGAEGKRARARCRRERASAKAA